MKRASLQRTIEGTPERVWTAWFKEPAFQTQLHNVLRIVCSDIKQTETGQWPEWQVDRSLVFDTDRDIPKVLLKLVSGVTRVTEITRFDAVKRTLTVDLVLPIIGKRVDFGYTYSWSQSDLDHMDVTWNGHCDVRIPLVRGLAENYLLGELTDATHAAADFIAQWCHSG